MVTIAEVAWTAGILEGEGSFSRLKTRNGSYVPRVVCSMSDRDVLEELQRIWGGKIWTKGEKRESHHKEMFYWSTSSQWDAVELMIAVLPFMGTRRSFRINELLSEWNPQRDRHGFNLPHLVVN